SCENVITVIQEFQDSVFVCGTNALKPHCWKLHNQAGNESMKAVESHKGNGISPFFYTQNSLSLSVEPTFISASWVSRKEDPHNDKIYIFFREKNSDSSPEADPWISRVARMCKVDEGGSKRFFQNIWTSFLKARLVCGIPKESLYFNRLHDIYIQHADDWRKSRVYALFSSSWNSSAVCIYSVKEFEKIFDNSNFKGFSGDVPSPRPGMCVNNTKDLPMSTISVIKDHPEMEQWIHPLHLEAPFYISTNNYTKIIVDNVTAADGRQHNVLFLATDSGKIHKILDDNFKPFIISETRLFSHNAEIQSIKLNPQKKKLYVGYADQIAVVDLQNCQAYGDKCEKCVLSRDPYCAWSGSSCAPVTKGAIQNLLEGNTSICNQSAARGRHKRDIISTVLTGHFAVPMNIPFYFSCPIYSQHATYTWEYNSKSTECQKNGGNCLHLIATVQGEDYGSYSCVSRERDYVEVIQKYCLNPVNKNAAAHIPVIQTIWVVIAAALISQLGR
ncbi:SEM7A protein, partial [Amia calva]|nr:SEM7A protein [Amia calva]